MVGLSQTPRSVPKARFHRRVEGGDYLNVTVWSGKKEPEAEVIHAEIRILTDDNWETVGRLVIYRTPEGEFRELPDRRKIE